MIAEEALRTLDFEKALALFDGDSPEAVGGRVRTLWAKRRYAEAEQLLSNGGPDHPATRLASGVIALGRRDDPVHLGIQFGSSHRDCDLAVEHFTAALKLGMPAVRGLATAHRMAWRLDEARALLSDDHPSLIVERAWCLVDEWDLEGALEVLATVPDDVEALFATSFVARHLEAFDTAERAVGQLRRRGANEVQTGIEAAWLADFRRRTLPAAEVVAAKADTNQAFHAVLRLDPGSPSAIEGAHWTGGYPDRLPAENSPSLCNTLAWQLVSSDQTKALAEARHARTLDPHMLRAQVTEGHILLYQGRVDEARQVLTGVLERCPRFTWASEALGWTELDAFRHEKALRHFTDAGPYGCVGRVATLRRVGCVDLAEEEAAEFVERYPGDAELLAELGWCAIDERRYRTAADRLNEVRVIDPDHKGAADWLRKTTWHRRLSMGWFDRVESAWGSPRKPVERWLAPDQVPLRLRARLRELDRRNSQANAVDQAAEPVAGFVLAAALLSSLAFGPILLSRLVSRSADAAAYGIWVGLTLAFAVAIFAALGSIETDRNIARTVSVLSFLDAVGIGWLLFATGGRPVGVAFFGYLLLTAVAMALVLCWFILGVFFAFEWAVRAMGNAARRRTPVAGLVHDLSELLDLLDYPPWLIEHTNRARCLELLDAVASGLGNALSEPVVRSKRTRPGGVEEFQALIAEPVAAVRALKRLVVRPTEEGWDRLRSVLGEMVLIACEGRWGDLPRQKPESAARVLRNRLVVVLRGALIVLVPPLALAGYQLAQGRGVFDAPVEFSVVLYVVWPLLSLMWWLDPNLSSKINALKSTTDVGKPTSGK
ncbi:hypothetical protein Lesp02_69810 [Lentzea sp. NBRC 105346]|uniref:tetratricopeptide repeat protein n=1 Tax=Lentzea sp. NBRC 105346 TaxID=3032205 RepID=UPI0024A222B2|nr:hypothetical protein [Lentzea sp. NBRC 105346]GLZ34794.1 hypothetical protein Lesp02_69810 [Lentzea sp. NBRC 105346]